jgi:hypothetical protein
MYPIKIRAGHDNGAELTFKEAVQTALGQTPQTRIVVTAVYAEDTDTGQLNNHKQPITHKAGEPVFGLDAEVICRRIRFGQNDDAAVSIGGIASHSPEVADVRIACYQLAAKIAFAANVAAGALAAS